MMRGIALLLALLAIPATAGAQRPGEIAGRVAENGSDAPVERAAVDVPELGIRAWTDGAGRFRLRAVDPGRYRVRIARTGYAAASAEVDVRAGEAAWIDVDLAPSAVALASITVAATGDPLRDGTQVDRQEIERSGARTAAEVIARVPGVIVRGTGPTSARTVSIRGSAADAVLVLVDGAPLNDPVTGEADLGTVPAGSIARVTVLAGAQSARYGPRALGGVVLIETRAGEAVRSAEASLGTLGERGLRGAYGGGIGGFVAEGGANVRTIDGGFDYVRDPNDPVVLPRKNADLTEWGGYGSLAGPLFDGELRLRAGADALDRGLPGVGHTPSTGARQEMARGRASASWRRGGVTATASGALQRIHFRDPHPPSGLPYDDTTRVAMLDARAESIHLLDGPGFLRSVGGGAETLVQRIRAPLNDDAPRTSTGFGAFAHAGGEAHVFGQWWTVEAQARIDRDGVGGGWYGTRALAVGTEVGAMRIRLSNRSAFSPPTLGDQFFRDGVAVQPNPDLRPERIPNEWELGTSLRWTRGGLMLAADAAAYTGDVRGMIVWMRRLGDRWSPGNVDTHRRGVDTHADVEIPAMGLRVRGAYGYARLTYDRTDDDGIQVVYRPRHAASLGAEWARGPWRASAGARWTGARNPTPTSATVLAGFWTTELSAGRDWRLGAWRATTALAVDRARDEKDALIAGYPEPGRRARLDVRIQRTRTPARDES